MNKKTKNKLFDLFYEQLKREVVVGDNFHVDIEMHEYETWFDMLSTMYAESPDVRHYHDNPADYKNANIKVISHMLVGAEKNGKRTYYDDESEDIIFKAIQKLTK